jgi:AraC family transcriptional regulator
MAIVSRSLPQIATETPQYGTGIQTIFSSHGTRWRGLTVELRWYSQIDTPNSYETAEPHIINILSKTTISWRARGIAHKEQWRPGTTIFLKDGFRLDDVESEGCESIVVALEPHKVEELLQNDLAMPSVNFLEHVISFDTQVAGMLNAMLAEARAGNPAGNLFSQSISIALLAHIFNRYDRVKAVKREVGRLTPRQSELISRYVRDRIDGELSIAGLAALLNLSPSYFCKAFVKSFGITPHRFVLNERISLAKQKLQQTTAPHQAELAKILGFADQAHFSNAFRKIVGCTPSEFSRRAR